MPKTKISEFSATPGNNTDIDGINISEGCAPSGINDAIRELMAQLKDFQAGTAGDSFNGPIGTTTPAAGVFTNLSASGTFALTGDQVQISEGGTGQTTANAAFNALAPSQSTHAGKYLKTDGTNTSWDALDISTADITGTLPIANGGTGLTALGTGVQTALGIAVGSSGAFVTNGGALGTPSSGTVTNLTGTASININGTVGATTPTTGAFTTLSASGNITVSGGTANGVAYLNGSKVLTTGSALTFDGTNLATTANTQVGYVYNTTSVNSAARNWATTTNDQVFGDFAIRQSTALGGNPLSAGRILYYINPTGDSIWYPGGSEQMRLTSTGLGIGTSSPASKLHVNDGGIRISSSAGSAFGVSIFSNGQSSGQLIIGQGYATATDNIAYFQNQSNAALVFGTNATERLRITSAGDVGIGTSTPTARLEIQGTNPTIRINDATAVYAYGIQNTASALRIYDYNATAERMRLDSSGNLGIGTSSPAFKLHVGGAGSQFALISTTDTTSTTGVLFGDSASNTVGRIEYVHSDNGMRFFTNGTTQATLDSSGNLGLGVAPSAWSAGQGFEMKNGGAIASQGSSFTIAANTFFASGTGWTYKTSSSATRYDQSSGAHQWYTAPSGTAGNAISFTQAMTLDASGNLGVGVTSIQRRLHLGGGANDAGIKLSTDTSGNGNLDGADITFTTTNTLFITNRENGATVFEINGSERARITSGGYSKFSNDGTYQGSTANYHEFRQTNNATGVYLTATNASYTGVALVMEISRNTTNNTFYAIQYYNTGAAANKFLVADSGNVTNTNGSYGTISDAKMKTDIVDAGSQWADIKAVRFRKFKMKDDPEQIVQLGVVAQELEQTSPGLVEEHKDTDAEGSDLGTTTKSVKTSVLLMKAAVALQEAMARIEQLEAKVAALEAK